MPPLSKYLISIVAGICIGYMCMVDLLIYPFVISCVCICMFLLEYKLIKPLSINRYITGFIIGLSGEYSHIHGGWISIIIFMIFGAIMIIDFILLKHNNNNQNQNNI